MLDFLKIDYDRKKSIISPDFSTYPIPKDLMTRGGDFYAIWNEEENMWSTDESVASRLIDKELDDYASRNRESLGEHFTILKMRDGNSGMIDRFHKYVQKQIRENFHALDEELIFENDEVTRESYASKKLDYAIGEGETPSWDELLETLYSPEERHKIEWSIGSIMAGYSKNLQKFIVFYGPPGTGKSTVIDIMELLFKGYFCVFESQALGASNSAFALESFRTNPLVAIQHEGDLSKIEDNARINSLVSHDVMLVNVKHKSAYPQRFNCFLVMATNKPVRITDAKSGIIRRLIDVIPTGEKVKKDRYDILKKRVEFELGAIAYKTRKIFLENPRYYDDYIPTRMLGATNVFYNFVLSKFDKFQQDDGVSLQQAWEDYKLFCEKTNIYKKDSYQDVREELKNYFKNFEERARSKDGTTRIRNYYSGFIVNKFIREEDLRPNDIPTETESEKSVSWLSFNQTKSILDDICSDCKAQYANSEEKPTKRWVDVETMLKDIDTSKLHYVNLPETHIFADFDIKDENGEKSLELNTKEAEKWLPTYAELSKSGKGIHLHYIYEGDPSQLQNIYAPGIEIKVSVGNSSLRRRLTLCNDIPIAKISSGLPLRSTKKVIDFEGLKNEKALRTFILRSMNKEYIGGTKGEINFIDETLNKAYEDGVKYDLTSLKDPLWDFAAASKKNKDYCCAKVLKLKLKSKDYEEADEPPVRTPAVIIDSEEKEKSIFDVEVYPNRFIVVNKALKKKPIKMVDPNPEIIESMISTYDLIGFNCRRYDNHICYARLNGYNNELLYEQSRKIISKQPDCFFRNAYGISYVDIYDMLPVKQSLKKWEIELGLHHQEMDWPWDEPLPDNLLDKAVEYCTNDVTATEDLWFYKDTQAAFMARKILASIAGMTINDTTNSLTSRIIFGMEKHPKLVYTDLATGEQF